MWKRTSEYEKTMMDFGSMLIRVLKEWLWRFLRRIDSEIVNKIAVAIKETARERTEIFDTVHDFSGKTIPSNIIQNLKLGSNFVVHTKMKESEARSKMEGELLSYLLKYRRYIEKKATISENDLHKWLITAIDLAEKDSSHHEFYSSLMCYSAIDMGVGKRRLDGKCPEFTKLDEIGVVVIEADKNMGICLINIVDLVKADSDMVKELGGEKLFQKNAEDLKAELVKAAQKFEEELDDESKKFLNVYYSDRLDKILNSELPFLKVRPKLHKLSNKQLNDKKAEDLKYRPVVDASKTPLRSYAQCLMEYLRDIIRRVDKKFFGGDGTMLKNGHAFKEIIDKLSKSDCSSICYIIADLSSAYSFIFLENLLVAMNFLGKQLEIPEWKIKFQEGIASLVLNNSLIETTEGIFKLNSCLPMGLCTSGECMDVVLLLAELVFLSKINAENIIGFTEQYGEITPGNLSEEDSSFLTYRRYRDDTFSCISLKDIKSPEGPINLLGKAFIPSLDFNIELSMYVGTFLDVKFYKRFSGEGMETLVRRKGKYPISFCHSNSNTSDSIVRSIVNGEILRHRRLTSSRKLQLANDESLVLELVSRGYNKEFLRKIVRQRIVKIGQDYNRKLVRYKCRENPDGIVFGAVSVFDEEWNTHYKVHRLLKQCLPIGVR